MKKYKKIELEIEKLATDDVISTSADVTTGGIEVPWQKNNASEGSVNILKPAYEEGYPVG